MNICYSCFREKQNSGPCPWCGYDDGEDAKKYPLALKPGAILNGRYTVGRVLGQGGFGITYIALDDRTKDRVAIKEFYPAEFVGRTQGSYMVQVHSEDQRENFEYGKEQFLAEAKTLAAFIGDSHIVRIHSYFEENSTAYFSMEYVDGLPLDKYMAQNGGRLSVEEASRLLLPLMDSMDQIHAKGIVHRDIAPDNIIIQKDGTAKLIDFGAARYSTGEKSKSLDVVLKHGFAPKEQYSRRGRQGPFTDVYAMGATYYYALTGRIPPDSIDRLDSDDLVAPSTLGVKISDDAEEALLRALEVNAPDRFQSMGAFHNAMLEAELLQRRKAEEIRETERRQRETEEQLRREAEERARREQEHREAEERARAEEVTLRREAEEQARATAEQQRQAAAPQQTPSPAPQKKSGGSKVISIVLGLAVVAAIGFFALKPKATPAVPKVSSIPTTAVTTTPAPTPSATSTPAPTPRATATPAPTATPKPGTAPAASGGQGAYSVGDYLTFGRYEQDNNTANGQEAIEWLVLDVKDDQALVISRYGLDEKRYNQTLTAITWEQCTLRSWLNSDFLNTAFTAEEQAAILTTSVDNSKNQGNSAWNTDGGKDTEDKIFLLSFAEAEKYFNSNEARRCKATDYAVAQGAYVSDNASFKGNCYWWLRSPGKLLTRAARVSSTGFLDDDDIRSYDNYVARPAFWINLKSGIV